MKAWLVLSFFVFTAVLQSYGDLRFAFIGKTGQGKSTLANAFMGNNETFEICEDHYDDPPCTKNVTEASNKLLDHSVRVFVTDTPGWGAYEQATDNENFDKITEIFEDWFQPDRFGAQFKRTFLLIQDGPYITPDNDSSTFMFLRQFQMKYGASVWSNFHIIADTGENCKIAQEKIREFLYVKIECIAVDVLGSPEISQDDLLKIYLAAYNSPDFAYQSMENYLQHLERGIKMNQNLYYQLQNRVNTQGSGIDGNRGDINRLNFDYNKLIRYVNDNHDFAMELSSSISEVDKDVKENKSSTNTMAYITLALGIICSLLLAMIIGYLVAKRDILKK